MRPRHLWADLDLFKSLWREIRQSQLSCRKPKVWHGGLAPGRSDCSNRFEPNKPVFWTKGFCLCNLASSFFFFVRRISFVFVAPFSRHIFLVIFKMANAAWSVRCRWSPKPVKGKGRPRSARWTKKMGARHGALRDLKLAGFEGTAWNSSVSLFQRSPRFYAYRNTSHIIMTYITCNIFERRVIDAV